MKKKSYRYCCLKARHQNTKCWDLACPDNQFSTTVGLSPVVIEDMVEARITTSRDPEETSMSVKALRPGVTPREVVAPSDLEFVIAAVTGLILSVGSLIAFCLTR